VHATLDSAQLILADEAADCLNRIYPDNVIGWKLVG
jgi:hypothetical protein